MSEAISAGRARPLRIALPYLALTILLLALYADPLFTGRSFFYRDLSLSMRPGLAEAHAGAAGGFDPLPLWTHAMSNGRALLANPGFALLAPLSALYLIFPFNTAFNLFLVLHVVIAGCAMVFLARRLGCGSTASFAAGAAYALGGGLVSAMTLYWTVVAAAWAPLVVAAGVAASERLTPRRVAFLALAIGLEALGGQPEPVAATLIVGVAVAFLVNPGLIGQRTVRVAVAWTAGIVGGLALAAPQLIPAALHAQTTLRALGFTPEGLLINSLRPLRALWLIVPRMGGSPLDSLRPGGFPGVALLDGSSPYLLSIYLGAVTALTAAAALVFIRRRPAARPLVWGLVGLALLGVVAACGRYVPGIPALVRQLPFVLPFRYPEKALFVTFLSVPILAALGIEALATLRLPRLPLLLASGIALDLVVAQRGYAPTIDVADLAAPPLARELLERSRALGVPDGAWRTHHQRDQRSGGWGPPAGSVAPTEEAFVRWQVRMLVPPMAAPFGIRAAMELQGDILDDLRYFALTRAAYKGPPESLPLALGEAGVLWVISPRADLADTTSGALVLEKTLGDSEGVAPGSGYLYRNTRFVPRARLTTGFTVIAAPELRDVAALALQRYGAGGPWPPASVLEAGGDPVPDADGDDHAPGTIVSLSDDHRGLTLMVEAERACVAVVSDAPGALETWSASIDGRPAPLWRANFAYLALPVEPGRHTLRLDYRPRGLRAGWITAAAALFVCAFALRARPT